MKLTFENSERKTTTILDNASTIEEVQDAITKYLESHHRKADYYRIVSVSPRKIMIDFGSWSEFFYLNISFKKYTTLTRQKNEKRRCS